MTTEQHRFVARLIRSYFAPIPKQSVSDWCEQEIRFNEPDCQGPFSLAGREYLREVLDDWNNPRIHDQILVFGTRTGKTRTIMGGMAWTIKHEPARMLWVMPNTHGTGGAQNVSRTRWQPMLLGSRPFEGMIPTGKHRHNFKSMQQIIGGALVDFAGSNSPANLAGNSCRIVVMDEVDKFKTGGKEADSVKLAENRAKEYPNPKRVKTSTPTLYDGLIWQEFLSGDQRRYFVPCPHCSKEIIFAWSKEYTVLPKLGCEAYIHWDHSAQRPDGTWDYERVKQSTRATCPHCQGQIQDAQKTMMIRKGTWRATNSKAPAHIRSRHLSSLYACTPQTSWGQMAVKFLKQKKAHTGLQDFINGDLAEPYMRQDRASERAHIIRGKVEITEEWHKILTSDCQRRAPYFHYVIRAWNGRDASHGIEFGMLGGNNLELAKQDLAALITKHGIHPLHVMLDSGYGARPGAETDFAVYLLCAEHSELDERFNPAMCLGWMPAKGMPGHRRWINKEQGTSLPYGLGKVDPMAGTSLAGTRQMNLFEFNSDFYKTELDKLRNGEGGFKWSVASSMDADEYWSQLNSEHQVRRGNLMVWEKLSKHRPNEALDCEVMQLAYASFHGYINLGFEQEKEGDEQTP